MNENKFFEIAIPREFLAGIAPDPALDYFYKVIVYYYVAGGIAGIQTHWQAQRAIDWTSPGLEDYFLGAIRSAQGLDGEGAE